RKNHLTRLAIKDTRRALACVVKHCPCPPPDVMNAGRVAPDFAKKGQHSVTHRRIQRSRCVIIEVNCFHREERQAGLIPLATIFCAQRSSAATYCSSTVCRVAK